MIVLPDNDALQTVRWHAQDGFDYTEPLPSELWHGSRSDIALVLDPAMEQICFICIARKGNRVSTRFSKVTLSSLHTFEPVRVSDWLAGIKPRFGHHLRSAIERPGVAVPPATWNEAIAVLIALRPQLGRVLERLQLQLNPDIGLTGQRREIFAQEKDATGVALDIAGLGRSALGSWQLAGNEPAPWLSGLAEGRTREDVLITHDASRVPDWWPLREPSVGVVEFADRKDNRLTVMNVNRTPVESVTGVDLLYYRHAPASFVLVQYKRLLKQSAAEQAAFLPGADHNLERELQRMRDVDALGDAIPPASDGQALDPVAEYRLHPRASWLKLCSPEPFDPAGDALIPGMYLPLDFYDRLALDDLTLGPRGGRRLDRGRVPRWLPNTLFVQLMSECWIGSRGLHTDQLSQIVSDALAGHRSVVIAAEERKTARTWR